MALKEQLTSDLKKSMKAGDSKTTGVLRLLLSAIHNKAIEKRGKSGSDILTDDEVMQVLMSEAKKRNDAIAIFEQGGRSDLADKERGELEILKKYLPQQLSMEDTEKAVERIMATLRQAQSDISFGNAMKEVMKELKGKADAKLISEIIKNKLGN